MVWQIEETKGRLAICRDCNRRIERGTYRFGNYDLERWYHLDCAAVRNSRAFAPFAKQAAALLSPATPTVAAPPARNEELEARLVADPDDDAIRAVYADWLQSIDDPWGELIALELAGRDARSVLKQHYDDLIGDFAPRMFEWRRGFIHAATLTSAANVHTLEALFALRTTMLLRELHALFLRPNTIEVLNEQAPRTLRQLSTSLTVNLRLLALPDLEQLTLGLDWTPDDTLEVIWTGMELPKLAELKLHGPNSLPVPALTALLQSNLVKQLRSLEITNLDESALRFVERQRALVAHIPITKFSR